MAQIVVVHGVGGPKPTADWMGPLNGRLAGLGYPRLEEPSDTIRVADFTSAFQASGGATPEVTYKRPADRDRRRLELEYASRQRELQRVAREHSEDRWLLGPDLLPAWMRDSGAFLADQNAPFFREVKQFMSSDVVRGQACRLVSEAFPSRGPVVLVAHSLGSVVSAGALRRLPPDITIDLFVTIGSPLSFDRYRDRVGDLWKDFPYGRVKSWLNVYSARDLVCAGRGISSAVEQAVDACVRVAGSHDVRAYMSHPVVAAAIGHAVFGEPRNAKPVGNVPARRIDPRWFPHLLSTAFTYQVAEDLKSDHWERYLRLQQARHEYAVRTTRMIARVQAERASEVADGPLAPGRHPTFHDLTDSAAHLLKEVRLEDDGVLVLATTLLLSPLVPPFDFDKWVDADDRREALEHTFNVVRDHTRGNLSDGRFAEQVADSIKWGRDQLKGGFPLGRVLIGVGVTALAATGIGLAVAAPAGLAGAAAITSTLAAFGPGGMVGGVATLSALTGTAGVLTTIGITEELSAHDEEQALTAAQAGHAVLATLEPEALASTLTAMLAVVHAQSKLGFDTTEPETREAISAALDDVSAGYQLHRAIAPGAKGTDRYERRIDLLDRALNALDELDLPHIEFHIALSKAVSEGRAPEIAPKLPEAPALGPGSPLALEPGGVTAAEG